jgi:hypothetical protein
MAEMKLGPSDLEVLRRYEVDQASRMRGGCRACGHTWRVRNPSGKVNRCPGCGTRSQVTYTVHNDLREVIDVLKLDASAERAGAAVGKTTPAAALHPKKRCRQERPKRV